MPEFEPKGPVWMGIEQGWMFADGQGGVSLYPIEPEDVTPSPEALAEIEETMKEGVWLAPNGGVQTYEMYQQWAANGFKDPPVLNKFGGTTVYTSYAGTDIVAEILLPGEEPLIIGELQTISYSMHRENTPVRFLGHVNPAGFVKGPRTIAGSLIFTVFNYYAFYKLKHFQKAISSGVYPVADMLPPFDVVLTFANESGVFSKLKIYGVTIVDEGQTMSIDDLVTEQTYSYMARGIQPLTGLYVEDA